MGLGYAFAASYWTVLVAELIGDKSIYTVASLSLRFRAGIVFSSMMVAFGGKMLVAVLMGHALTKIPVYWTTVLSPLVFFSTAIFIWFKKPESLSTQPSIATTSSRVAIVPFASLFFTEWGDPGQFSAAALTLQSRVPLVIWLGGTLALMTKGAFAVILGLKLRNRIPEKVLRTLAAASCSVLGVLALRHIL